MLHTPAAANRDPRRILRFVFVAVPFLVVLGLTLLVFNALQVLSALLALISHRAAWAFNRFAADTWWGWCVILARVTWGVRYEVTGDELPKDENALIVVNHQTMTDIPCLMALAHSHGRLGDLKWFVKDIIKYVPGIGWGMLFLDCVFVRRDWTKDRSVIGRVFGRLIMHRTPFWLVLFAEGTRMSPTKLVRSQTFQEKKGKRLTRHVLSPRTAGFIASVQGLSGSLQAVYDITIGYPDAVPTMRQYLCGHFRVGHLHVRRIPASALPASDDDLAKFLVQLFEDKDTALARFGESGRF